MSKHPWLTLVALGLFAASSAADDKPPAYPQTRRDETADTLHGVRVPDPYRWLEEDVRKSREVAAWVEDENKVTQEYLRALPQREAIRKRLTELWDFEKYTPPSKSGGRYFYSKNNGLQNQAVLYTLDALNAEPRVLI